MNNIKTAFKMIVVLTVITGVAYPLVVTVLSQLLFSKQANGSIISQNGKSIGSQLVGQKFTSEKYFWTRPSAVDYNPMPSSGSNLGPTSVALLEAVNARRESLLKSSTQQTEPPADLLFASGSGLDPHISPEAAQYQVGRIVKTRQLDPKGQKLLLSLIVDYTSMPTFGILGEPRVNVLELNLAIDSVFAKEH